MTPVRCLLARSAHPSLAPALGEPVLGQGAPAAGSREQPGAGMAAARRRATSGDGVSCRVMPAMAARRSPLVCATVLAALLAPAVARADSLVTELARDTPISAYGGALAWSAYDEASGRYSLVVGRPRQRAAVR